MDNRENVKIPEHIKKRRDELIRELEKMSKDPALRQKAEELHREISYLTAEELLRPFTI
jgi:tripartite-type tricarboxylate transporter receptor subunit TctC